MAHELRTASLPFAAFEEYAMTGPVICRASLEKSAKGICPEPDALRQSAQ
jgi:hypothetical protein